MPRVLVVDDDARLRLLLTNMLEIEGYDVLEAANGAHAIDRYRENPADLVLMDVIMPEQDGLETITELKNQYPDVKIFAMSGGGQLDSDPGNYLRMATHLGAARGFSKPLDLPALIEQIHAILEEPCKPACSLHPNM